MPNTFYLNLNPRAFVAIKVGRKKVEVRANKNRNDSNSVNNIRPGDFVVFKNVFSGELLTCVVENIVLYSSVRELLESEGVENTLSSTSSIEEGIKSIHSINDYEEYIKKYGVFAIRIKKL